MKFPEKVDAILFDMDGVLLDSERGWRKYEKETFVKVGIKELPQHLLGQIYGISMQQEYDLLKSEVNVPVSYDEYVANYDSFSKRVYAESDLADELDVTLSTLKMRNIKFAIVSASLGKWIALMMERLNRKDYFDVLLSISDEPDLSPKPSPDGYLRAIELLGVKAENTIIIEDSNRGIKSGNAAGVFTIATSEFVDSTYKQTGHDLQISKLRDILQLVGN